MYSVYPNPCPQIVTTVSPMKRGLKGKKGNRNPSKATCYNRFPDEKGTESVIKRILIDCLVVCYNRFPDEKGTERLDLTLLNET